MTNYNERLDEILDQLSDSSASRGWLDCKSGSEDTHPRNDLIDIAKQALNSLIKELVAEARPEKHLVQEDSEIYDDYDHDREQLRHELQENNINIGHNSAIDLYEQNLLNALEEV